MKIVKSMKSSIALGLIMLGLTLAGLGCGSSSSSPAAGPSPAVFTPNSFPFWNNPSNWSTSYGPNYADILLTPTNFVPCLGGPFALCYYAGPAPNSCTLNADGTIANCQCFDINFGQYFVDINSILNYSVYQQTVSACGANGAACQTLNSAPVCQAINSGTFMPGASAISTFSFDCVPSNGIGQTQCGQAPYAGCMTAACYPSNTPGEVNCQCPVFNGPYQVGQNDQQCTLGGNEVWSAAYAPTPTSSATPSQGTYPKPAACVPDAPGGIACPLYVPGQQLPPNSGVDCAKVCDEYTQCNNSEGIQVGFSCDSTLCTRECNDSNVVAEACNGLGSCAISEIIKAETAASCSCCASQLCGCQADAATNNAIYLLNQQQRADGIKPQCDVNGTLCGTTPTPTPVP